MNTDSISKNIRYFRFEKGLSQQELGDKIGVSWEMISRYERGESSPLNKVDELSEALDIDTSLLFSKPYKNKSDKDMFMIPYFNRIPKNNLFSKNATYDYYNSPIWIINRDKHSFAINPKLIKKTDLHIEKAGPVFISPKSEIKKDQLFLFFENSHLKIEKFPVSNVNKSSIVGLVLAQEKRFV